jgi:hypothetical protein
MNIASRSPIYGAYECRALDDVARGNTLLLTHRKATRPTVKPRVRIESDCIDVYDSMLTSKESSRYVPRRWPAVANVDHVSHNPTYRRTVSA